MISGFRDLCPESPSTSTDAREGWSASQLHIGSLVQIRQLLFHPLSCVRLSISRLTLPAVIWLALLSVVTAQQLPFYRIKVPD